MIVFELLANFDHCRISCHLAYLPPCYPNWDKINSVCSPTISTTVGSISWSTLLLLYPLVVQQTLLNFLNVSLWHKLSPAKLQELCPLLYSRHYSHSTLSLTFLKWLLTKLSILCLTADFVNELRYLIFEIKIVLLVIDFVFQYYWTEI